MKDNHSEMKNSRVYGKCLRIDKRYLKLEGYKRRDSERKRDRTIIIIQVKMGICGKQKGRECGETVKLDTRK